MWRRSDDFEVTDRDRPAPHVHLIVDEFQENVGRGFASLMAQARKFGCSIICANQSTEQLKNRDLSLANIVRDNTAAKIYFIASGKEDIEELQSYSKKSRSTLKTWRDASPLIANAGKGGGGESHSEYVTPLLTENNIIDTTATEKEFYLIEQTGNGHKEPVRTRGRYVLPESDYIRFLNTPLEPVKRQKIRKEQGRDNSITQWQKQHRTIPNPTRLELLNKLFQKVGELSDEQRWS